MNVRTDLRFLLVCSKCGKQLCVEMGTEEGATNAYNLKIRAKVEPCKVCEEKALAPLRKFKESMDLLEQMKDV